MYISVGVHLCAHPSQAAEGMNVPPQKQCYFIHDALSEAFGGMLCLQASLYSPSGSLQPLVCSYSGAVPMTLLSHMCATAGRPLFCCHRGLEGICLQIQLSPSLWAGHHPSIWAAPSRLFSVSSPDNPRRWGRGGLTRLHK